MSRRSKFEIRLKILEAIREGVDKPTRIMYASNLSWNPTKKILENLVENGLVTEICSTESKKSRRRYMITDKGVAVLDYLKNAKKILPIDQI